MPDTPIFSPVANPGRRLCLGALGATALMLAGCGRADPLEVHGTDITGAKFARSFSLKDPAGRVRTLEEFKGRAVLVFFGFTQCPDVCPTALVRAADAKKLLGDQGDRLQVVFITVDPERDVPEVLGAYTTAFDPDFLGLYGDIPTTAATAKEFKVFYQKVATGDSYTMDHTALSYLIDPQGKVRVMIRDDQSAPDLADDIRQVLRDV